MNKEEIINFCKDLAREYIPVNTPSVEVNPRLYVTNGRANWVKNKIELSERLLNFASEESILNCFLHELAHILTPREGHSHIWKKKFIELGGNGKRTNAYPNVPYNEWVMEEGEWKRGKQFIPVR